MKEKILVRKSEDEDEFDSDGMRVAWYLAFPDDGYPALGEFANQYRYFRTKKDAVKFLRKRGYQPVFD